MTSWLFLWSAVLGSHFAPGHHPASSGAGWWATCSHAWSILFAALTKTLICSQTDRGFPASACGAPHPAEAGSIWGRAYVGNTWLGVEVWLNSNRKIDASVVSSCEQLPGLTSLCACWFSCVCGWSVAGRVSVLARSILWLTGCWLFCSALVLWWRY